MLRTAEKEIRAIFWDNDGILVDTEPLYYRASRDILKSAGIDLSRDEFARISLQEGRSVFTLAERKGFAPEQVETLRLARNVRYAELLRQEARALDGVEEVLKSLHGRVAMAVVTGSLGEHFNIIHQRTGLLKYFDFILTREDYTHGKPHPDPYLTALARSGLAPRECLAVEDSERGLLAASRAGLRCLAVPGHLTRKGDFGTAWQVLSSVREIPGFIS